MSEFINNNSQTTGSNKFGKRKFYFCDHMENTTKLKYLKGIVLASIAFYILFIILNTLEGIWEGAVFFGIDRTGTMKIMAIEGKIHFWADNADYLLQLAFFLVLNRFVRKYTPGKGFHFLLVIAAFIPLVNYIFVFIIWKRLNREFCAYSGMNASKSDGKITGVWIIQWAYLVLTLSLTAILYYSGSPELISSVTYYARFAYLVKSVALLVVSVIYLLYYLELRRALNRAEPGISDVSTVELLDN